MIMSPLHQALIQRQFAGGGGQPHMGIPKAPGMPMMPGLKPSMPRPFQRPIMSGLRPSALMPRIGL